MIDVDGNAPGTQSGLPSPPPARPIDNTFVQPQPIAPVESTDDSEPYRVPELMNELDIPLDALFQEKLSEVQRSKMAHIDVLQLCRICLCNLKYECVYDVFDPDPALAREVLLRFNVQVSVSTLTS